MKAITFLMCLICACTMAWSQNLTAAQMNIYFGSPKKATVTTPQGTVVTEFDGQGRIISVTQGNMRMVYDWESVENKIIVSMFQGPNFKDKGEIVLTEFLPRHYRYSLDGSIEIDVTFMENGALDVSKVINPQATILTRYLYREADDVYPYAIENSFGEQAVEIEVAINKLDDRGNAVSYTQTAMGQAMETTVELEYY